jgi:hypothetical protein
MNPTDPAWLILTPEATPAAVRTEKLLDIAILPVGWSAKRTTYQDAIDAVKDAAAGKTP